MTARTLVVSLFVSSALVITPAIYGGASGGATERVSVAWNGDEADGQSQLDGAFSKASADGRYVVFASYARNLVPGGTNGDSFIYVRDRTAATTELVSIGRDGSPANNRSFQPCISDDGRYVAFLSYATNLLDPLSGVVDTNNTGDVYVRDLVLDKTELVSVATDGTQGNAPSERPQMSADGRYVVFDSMASTLLPSGEDTNGETDVYLRDRSLGTTTRVSVRADGVQGNGYANFPAISDNGRIIGFSSASTNMLVGQSFGQLVRDMSVGSNWTFEQLPGDAGQADVSGDGRYLAYVSSTDLVPEDTNGSADTYRYDRQTASVHLVSRGTNGFAAGGSNGGASVSIDRDGDSVAFMSASPDLVAPGEDNNDFVDVFLWKSGVISRSSVAADGTEANNGSTEVSLNSEGDAVVFSSYATNLILPTSDSNGGPDVFVRVASQNVPPADPTALGQFTTGGSSISVAGTVDGTSMVFRGTASDPDGDAVRLEVEVKQIGTDFDGSGIVQGSLVPSGSVSEASVAGLIRTRSYHWRARTIDQFGAPSQNWVSFGANAETGNDFFVEAPIVFSSGNGNAQDIWLMNPDGTGLTRLTINPGFDGAPSLSPAGTKVAYMSRPTTGGSNNDIWVMNVDGSQKTQLTTNPGTDERPTWSGDGTRIAFSSIRTTFSNTADIWSMKADGSDLQRLTTANGSDAYPAWSRDGTKIAFSSVRDGNEEIFLMNPNGTGQTQLTFTKGSVRNTTPTLSPTVSMTAQTAFVTRSGTRLLLNGKSFRFTGINIYNANSQGLCWYNLRSGAALDGALTAIGPGHEVIRAWFFQPLATANGQRDWSAFDHTLAVAGAHGMKVVPTLTDQYGECGDGGVNGFKPKEWYQTGYKQVDPANLVSYRDWVAEVVTRYKNDPRIAFWQLVNEAEVTEVVAGVRQPCPQGTDEPADILKAWATDVSGLVKSIDQNHLISLGTIGNGQCGAQGPQYQSVHGISTIDLCEYHDYGSPNVPMPGDQFNGLQVRINQCNALNKPVVVGEAGIIPNDVGGTLPKRAAAFQAKIDAQFAAGIQGFLAWDWSSLGSTLDNYDIGPGDPALESLIGPSALSVAFSSNRASNNWEIYSLAVASPATVTRLTTRSQSDLAPSWSRDGSRIVFASGNPNGTGYDIWRMQSAGSSQLRLTTTTPNDNAPNW